MRFPLLALCLVALLGLTGCDRIATADARSPSGQADASAAAQLPREVFDTIALIRRGGPFPYQRDGVVFHNRERRLPPAPRGHYHEYTVPTPGSRTRGARHVVSGGNPPAVFYYTADHYVSFHRVEPER
jgi:guanyl-specific ribonuclease Sa